MPGNRTARTQKLLCTLIKRFSPFHILLKSQLVRTMNTSKTLKIITVSSKPKKKYKLNNLVVYSQSVLNYLFQQKKKAFFKTHIQIHSH